MKDPTRKYGVHPVQVVQKMSDFPPELATSMQVLAIDAGMVKEGQKVICPICGQKQEDHVEDYVVPGKSGAASVRSDECFECGAAFEVEHVGSGDYVVRRI